mmetsp:Transcript_1599/g.4804  ORF Transcript_1599/g.4804 Transcript_1599/m.4804 type:complete len:320 (-) Transcript_1599:2035-2994(-)|eukprot:CAMPEP_0198725694 /NCGR_PEP_ID=MMETSP1475-20131203/2947_1 /TAXON_ID= ORGANISM="Unidentified sp., Strain CCMP1999" /NCGR_SAMPLE_ID=MMETSP1475 /ASSEMBLY_ACC=CAM_ASM_001111 /LENGTH=319 /DNA_ID=CAMNT_0044487505 /DNA_START=105 /DNA_END=1064 /DNA_ORIENTATION=-
MVKYLGGMRSAWDEAVSAVKGAEDVLKTGAVASAVSMSLCIPVDVRKTLVQASTATSDLAISAMLKAQKNPFAGLLPALLAQLPSAVVTFGAFEMAMANLKKRMAPEPIGRKQVVLAACISDLVGSLWITPLESIKQKIQIGRFENFTSALRGVMRSGGISEAYQGFFSVVARDCTYRALHLILLDELRQFAKKKFNRPLKLSENVLLSTAVATVAAIITTPLDLVKTRMMTQRLGVGKSYSWFGDALVEVAKRETARGLFRGFVPRVGYVAGTSLIFLLAYDRIATKFGKVNSGVNSEDTIQPKAAFIESRVVRKRVR